jgi:hypothetical protein
MGRSAGRVFGRTRNEGVLGAGTGRSYPHLMAGSNSTGHRVWRFALSALSLGCLVFACRRRSVVRERATSATIQPRRAGWKPDHRWLARARTVAHSQLSATADRSSWRERRLTSVLRRWPPRSICLRSGLRRRRIRGTAAWFPRWVTAPFVCSDMSESPTQRESSRPAVLRLC